MIIDSLRVLSENASQLVVAQNAPFRGADLFWMLFPWGVGALAIGYGWHASKAKLGRKGLVVAIIGVILFCLIFDFAGGARFFVKHTLTLSRGSGQAVSEERWFGNLADRTVYDLNAIQYAQLESARSGTKRIVLVMKDDSVVVPLRSVYSDEQGYYAVVNAINRFLGVQRAPVSSNAPQP